MSRAISPTRSLNTSAKTVACPQLLPRLACTASAENAPSQGAGFRNMAPGEAEAPEEAPPPGAAGSEGGSAGGVEPALLEEDAQGLGRQSEELRPV